MNNYNSNLEIKRIKKAFRREYLQLRTQLNGIITDQANRKQSNKNTQIEAQRLKKKRMILFKKIRRYHS